jgi:hypothetical protein
MEQNNLQQAWNGMNAKLEANLLLNKKLLHDVTQLKIKALLSSMKPIKWFALVVGIVWVVLVDFVIVATFGFASDFFIVSAVAQSVLTKLAIAYYLYQLILLNQIDFAGPLVGTQLSIFKLQASTLWIFRVLILQLPFWTTFYITTNMLRNASVIMLGVQVLATLTALFVAIWLFIHVKPANYHKKWFQWIFTGKEWTPLMESLRLVAEMEQAQAEPNL